MIIDQPEVNKRSPWPGVAFDKQPAQHDTKDVGVKYDMDKPDYSLMPPAALEDIVKVLTLGAQKYSRDNWKILENAENRYFAAAQRHMWARQNGEIFDAESGIDHAAHAVCCMIFLMAINKQKK